jgi:stalled ribosome rescue protein Dom34
MRKVCVWIDHSRAVIAAVDDGGEESLETIPSHARRHAKPQGASGTKESWGPQTSNHERSHERRYENHLAHFYRDVIRHLGHPDQLVVMGPAQAKQELKAEIEESLLRDVHVVLETAGEMTDPQVLARLRSFEIN